MRQLQLVSHLLLPQVCHQTQMMLGILHSVETDRQLFVLLLFPVLGGAPNNMEISSLAHKNFVGDSVAMKE
jgi:hypothetical protein